MVLTTWMGRFGVVATLGVVAGCGTRHGAAAADSGEVASRATAKDSGSASSKVGALVTVDQFAVEEIQTGALARRLARHEDVRQLATALVEDHSTMRADVHALAQRLGVLDALSDSALSTEAKAHIDTLRGLPAASFDRAYVDRELAAHEQFDRWLNQITSRDGSSDLDRALARLRPQVAAHLARIREVRSKLGGAE